MIISSGQSPVNESPIYIKSDNEHDIGTSRIFGKDQCWENKMKCCDMMCFSEDQLDYQEEMKK
jgi:hypothetical protein